MSWVRARLAGRDREAGLTLVEMLVAASMGVVLLGVAGSLVVSAARTQPKVSKRAQNITTARWVLERMTREIRNGVSIYRGNASEVEFLASVRRTECGGAVEEEPNQPAIRCRVAYRCTTTACSRSETAPEVEGGGTETTIVSGLDSSQVFNFEPPPSGEDFSEVSYIGLTLDIPNPEGSGDLTISDGASLRTLVLAN
jgi:hypothetical protein